MGFLAESSQRLAAGHALAIRPAAAIYSYIPKNACSLLRHAVALANGLSEDEALQALWGGAALVAGRAEIAAARYVFVVLRCPYRRTASAFLDRIAGPRPRARHLLPRYRGIVGALRWPFAGGPLSPEDAAAVAALTFTGFLRLLRACPPRARDHHFRSQSDFLLARGYDDVFAVEALDAAAPLLAERAGLRIDGALAPARHHIAGLERVAGDASEMTVATLSGLLREGRAPDYAALYGAESRALVEEIHGADLALYRRHFGAAGLLFPGA